jgi:hypothetical protein
MTKKKTIPVIPVREDWDPDEWGNIKHPTLSDQELLTKNWNKVTANKERDPEFKKKISDKVNAWYKTKAGKKQKIKNAKRLNKSVNKRYANMSDQERQELKLQRQKQAQDPNYKKRLAEGVARREADPEFRKKQLEAIARRNKNPKFLEAVRKGVKKRQENPANREKHLRTFGKPLQTPDGVFTSLVEADDFYNKKRNFRNGRRWIQGMMKKQPDDYYHITWEEYDKIK